jgi:Zn-dependent protease
MIFKIIRSNYQGDWRMLLVQLVAFLVSIYFAIVLHEVAHGLVAHWYGDDTAKNSGRLTLDPIKHIDPLGAVMMLVVGIGWAKPVPINPYNLREFKKGMIAVSLAGIVTNLILATLSLGLMAGTAALFKATVKAYDAWYYICLFFLYIFELSAVLNISLAGFNLLPIFPLDGFRLVEILTKPNNAYVNFMRRYGLYVYFVLVGLSLLADFTGLPCDVLGMYIGAIQSGMEKLINLILGAV